MKRGFTLVEMVLVLVIVSVLAQLTNVMIKSRREEAIVDVLAEYIQVFIGAIRMYYYNHNGTFPSDFGDGIEIKTIKSLKPYLPRNFSNFKIVEGCTVMTYVKTKENENNENITELLGYGIVAKGIKNDKILTKLKDHLLLEINMKGSNKENIEPLLDLIVTDITNGKLTFYLKTADKSYL